MHPVLGFFPNGVDIIGARLVEPALAVGFGTLMQAGPKSGRKQTINMDRR